VRCPEHGIHVAAVPWARPRSRFTKHFEEIVAWLAARMDRTSITRRQRITWRTATAIIDRVVGEILDREDLLDGLTEIGIDEISYRKGQKYLVVVVDHRRDRLVYAAEGRTRESVEGFFRALGPERCRNLRIVTTDGAPWIQDVVRRFAPGAEVCLDPFHVVQWATRAVDDVRRETWNRLRRSGDPAKRRLALSLKRCRFALWKAGDRLSPRDQVRLSLVRRVNSGLWRAWLLKEQLREIVRGKPPNATELLRQWLAWAQRSRLRPFVELARRIRRHLEPLLAALALRRSNARIESANTRIRLLHRLAFGFHHPRTMIAMAFLTVGRLCPDLPRR